MICPKCGNGEINDSGTCPVCGLAAAPESPEAESALQAEPDAAHVGVIPMDYTGPSAAEGAELPAWRLELSRRLQEIKRKRETGDQPSAGDDDLPPQSVPEEPPPRKRLSRPRPVPALVPPPAEAGAGPPPEAPAPAADSAIADRLEAAAPEVPAPPPSSPEPASRPAPAAGPKQANIQDLIDSIMTGKSGQPDAAPVAPPPPAVAGAHGEGKLILLSRTLSGLVDLLIVILCTGAFILAVDFISGIEVLDDVSLFHYGQLLLAIFLLYSIFMLGTANQTIGMMITDLRVVGPEGERPSIRGILLRIAAFLVSLLAFGIGLIWAVFDRQSLCLHDRISGTEVVRV